MATTIAGLPTLLLLLVLSCDGATPAAIVDENEELKRLSTTYRDSVSVYLIRQGQPNSDTNQLRQDRKRIGKLTDTLLSRLIKRGTTEKEVRSILGEPIFVVNPEETEGLDTEKIITFLGPEDGLFYSVMCSRKGRCKVSGYQEAMSTGLGL